MRNPLYPGLFALMLMVDLSCSKSGFLNTKPNASLVVPSSLSDFQALLDNDIVMNGYGNGVVPSLGEIGADNYYLLDANYNSSISALYRNCYTWQKQLYTGDEILDWDFPYRVAFYSNVVLTGLSGLSVTPAQQTQYNNEKGSALFFRAHAFYQLTQVFAPYYSINSNNDNAPGIPLRLQADINEPIRRAGLKASYDQVFSDLQQALPLLPTTPLFKTRPSKTAAYALLARAYLAIQDYDHAGLYADSSLQLQSTLLDYNTLSPTATFAFARFNSEVIFHANLVGSITPIRPGLGKVDSSLFASYNTNDLRRTLFFKNISGGFTFVGSYDGSISLFGGLTTDEMYLVRAECHARAGDVADAMQDLNHLLLTRWKTGTFTALSAGNADDALKLVLTERRKELPMRGLRWTDLRRLNRDSRFAATLQRVVAGQSSSLPPNDLRYVYPIPDNVIGFNPGMTQNPR